MSKGKASPSKAGKRAMAPTILRSKAANQQLLSTDALNEYATFFAFSKVAFENGEKIMREKKVTALAEDASALQHVQLKILEQQMAAVSRYLGQQYVKCKKV